MSNNPAPLIEYCQNQITCSKVTKELVYCIGTWTRHSWIHHTVAEFWNRQIRLSCYYNRVYKIMLCQLNIHLTPICNALVHVIYSVVSGQYSSTISWIVWKSLLLVCLWQFLIMLLIKLLTPPFQLQGWGKKTWR